MNVKKLLCLLLALCMLTLCACGGGGDTGGNSSPSPSQSGNADPSPSESGNADPSPSDSGSPDSATPSDEPSDDPGDDIVSGTGPTDLNFSSAVTDMEGDWTLSQVFVEGETYDAVADALTFKITLELDPSELVDGDAYIHNQVYNPTGFLTFGVQAIVDELAAGDVDSYKGTTAWSDFPRGEVVGEGEFYKQPGPATMRFKDIDDYGLFLDQIAGVTADVDTTEKTLIIGMNTAGQLLLGYSEEHIERPGTEGEWVYLLIFDKVA